MSLDKSRTPPESIATPDDKMAPVEATEHLAVVCSVGSIVEVCDHLKVEGDISKVTLLCCSSLNY